MIYSYLPSPSLAGWYERTRRGWRPIEFGRPAGRWNLICRCVECARFCHDMRAEGGYSRANFPRSDQNRRSTNWLIQDRNVCGECAVIPSCPIYCCEFCGIFGSSRRVRHWDECWHPKFKYRANWQSPYEHGSAQLCAKCARKLRKLVRQMNDADETRRLINRCKKEIDDVRKASYQGH